MVDLGLAGVEGVALEPLPLATEIANTLPAPATFTTTDAGPYFNDADLGANGGQITLSAKVRFATGQGNNGSFFGQSGGGFELTRLSNDGSIRANVEDSAGAPVLSSNTLALQIAENTWTEVVCCIDLVAQTLTVWKDGVSDQVALAANNGQFLNNRFVTLLNRNGSGGYQFVGDVEFLRLWKDTVTTDGSEPVGVPDIEVLGPASAANAHPTKRGADASG
ncbi:LamG-like jellyroll fold domain-containing protein [Fluviibacterium sp. DFM31]|uniref:LamG-like jellyroll fold domain-containing protein n=1 Tax=Meridianimarinicoccus marinus TaxID=3231483 RepID=A0ABV3L8F4_9RHOB